MPVKKTKLSKLTDRDEDFFKSKSLKERKAAVNGKWDSADTYNLEQLFSLYDRSTGGKLRRFCNQLSIERALNNKTVQRHVMQEEKAAFSLPEELQMFMERYYPSIWTNQEHARQFIKHFPMFRR